MTEEEELTRMLQVGESSGLQEASAECMSLALKAFEIGEDDLAKKYRTLGNEFKKRSNERHPGPPEEK